MWRKCFALCLFVLGLGCLLGRVAPRDPAPSSQLASASAPGAPRSAAPKHMPKTTRPPAPRLESTVQSVVHRMSSAAPWTNDDQRAREALLRSLAPADLPILESWAEDPGQRDGVRNASLYLLTQAGPRAIPLLAEFAESSMPASQNRAIEFSLRITALEALDHAASQGGDLAPELRAIVQTQSDPSLRFLAGISLSGIEAGRPGKLGRYIDQTLNGN